MSYGNLLPDRLNQLTTYQQLFGETLETILSELGRILFYLDHPDSGRLLESMFQLLPDDHFNILTALLATRSSAAHAKVFTELIQVFAGGVAIKIADKLQCTLTTETLEIGVASVFAVIHHEGLRRQGLLEYMWPNDMFQPAPDKDKILTVDMGFSQLTQAGKDAAYLMILTNYESKYLN